MSLLGNQAGTAGAAYITGTQIQGLVILNYPDYEPKGWHGTLLTTAASAFSMLFNSFLAQKLPLIEGVVVMIHMCSFFGIIVSLWVLSPRTDAMTIFTQFDDDGGWGSVGASTLLGISASALPLLGGDASAHMAEEVQDAGRNVPRAMIWSMVINGALAWIMVITFCFCVGDLAAVLATPTGYPFIQVFYNSTQSITGATVMASTVIAVWILSNGALIATMSRLLYAFARDDGLPSSDWFSKVSPRWGVPLNAIMGTCVFSTALALINTGSTTALLSIMSLCVNAVLFSYICAIGCILWRRCAKKPLLPSIFSLGKWGLLVNISAEIFLLTLYIVSFFPSYPTADLAAMNWSVVMNGGVLVFSTAYYFFYGRYKYVGPVEYTRKAE
jgi:choline transport protein